MSEKHELAFEEFDLRVEVSDDGDVGIEFVSEGEVLVAMKWEDFREMMEFIGRHGLAMKEPMFVEYAATVEGTQVIAEAAA